MIVLGLTGSIGMGKSATADMFRDAGILVYDADAAVHDLYKPGGGAVSLLEERFPNVIVEGGVDRVKLRAEVLNNPKAMADLEAIVHPLTAKSQLLFREAALEAEAKLIVLDVPLLFETGGDHRCDYVAVVTASAETQRSRVLARAGMTEEAFEAILAKQIPDAEKRARADFVISSDFGFDFARDLVRAIIKVCETLSETRPE